MIRAEYNRVDLSLLVRGHAQSAPKGEDLICAAASILAFTAEGVLQNEEAHFMPRISRRNGEFRIVCQPKEGQVARCRQIFDTIFTGFEILANEYPDYVRVTKEE